MMTQDGSGAPRAPGRASSSFVAPDFDAPVDVAAYLRACPASATARGTFFQFLIEIVEKERRGLPPSLFEGVKGHRWISWSSYPLSDFIRLAANAARILHPELSLGEGLRRIGWLAYPSFAATMAGRVVLMAFGDDAEALMEVLPKAYAVSLTGATVTSKRIAAGHWEVALRDVYNYAAAYQLGVIEGSLKARGAKPAIRIHKHARPSDLDLEVRW